MLKLKKRHVPLELLTPYLPKNPIIVEAGAHIGRGTKKMAAFWPHGTIHAFEPVPELFKRLKEVTQNCTNVVYHHYALSDTTGTIPFYVSGGRTTSVSSLIKPQEFKTERPDVTFKTIQVQTITLDDWATNNTIDHVDLLWLDLQGAELLALQGAKQLLKTVKAIHTEVNLTERYKNNPLYEELKKWLEAHGFEAVIEAFRDPTWGNVLFVNKNPDAF